MAKRAPSRCTQCPRLATNAGRCDDHQPRPWGNASANSRTLTGSDRARFHAEVMRDADYRCAWCGMPADIADHVIEIADGGNPHDPGNGQALCTECDKIKTRTAAKARAARRRAQRETGTR